MTTNSTSHDLTAFLYAADFERLAYPPDCPFKTERIPHTRHRLTSLGLLHNEVTPRLATDADLEQFHTPEYLAELQRAAAGDLTVAGLHMGLGTPDTPIFPDMLGCGRWAAGSILTAANLILTGKARTVFSPFGGFHHARAAHAAGFCYINDIVLGCQALAQAGKRVLCLDLDAHHGDGTQEAFYERNDVFTISMHETGHALFPWGGFENEIGRGPGLGFNVNIPLPPETYDAAYRYAFDRLVIPLAHAYNPDVLVVELGMDTLAGDPLTHLRLTNNAYVPVLRALMALNKPILATGGGGYHVENTVRGWARAWQILTGNEDDHLTGMGGVFLESTEWTGGLQDRELPVSDQQRRIVEPALDATIRTIIETVFPIYGLKGN